MTADFSARLAQRLHRASMSVLHRYRRPNYFLKKAKGVIHVGANRGQERDLYASHDLNVLWIEPIPDVFEQLQREIAGHPKQQALCCLITDVDGKDYPFHVSSNKGASSSIFELGEHKQVWPHVSYTSSLTLKSVTLSTLVKTGRIDLSLYDSLIMDTQGSELLVLRGAQDLLPRFKYIKTEAADFNSYVGGCRLNDLDAFLSPQGFYKTARKRFAHKEGIGAYYDVAYSSYQASHR